MLHDIGTVLWHSWLWGDQSFSTGPSYSALEQQRLQHQGPVPQCNSKQANAEVFFAQQKLTKAQTWYPQSSLCPLLPAWHLSRPAFENWYLYLKSSEYIHIFSYSNIWADPLIKMAYFRSIKHEDAWHNAKSHHVLTAEQKGKHWHQTNAGRSDNNQLNSLILPSPTIVFFKVKPVFKLSFCRCHSFTPVPFTGGSSAERSGQVWGQVQILHGDLCQRVGAGSVCSLFIHLWAGCRNVCAQIAHKYTLLSKVIPQGTASLEAAKKQLWGEMNAGSYACSHAGSSTALLPFLHPVGQLLGSQS